ncbi:MAG: hypothetical protein V3U90_03505 [Dehalococcoidia bacterium]
MVIAKLDKMKFIALLGIALIIAATACGAERGSYVQANEQILETLPKLPGAELLAVESSAYYQDDRPIPIGYGTRVTYKAPADVTTQEVIDFYVENLKDKWEHQIEERPIIDLLTGQRIGSDAHVTLTQGIALVSINPDNMYEGGPHTFDVHIDHRGIR